jgi:hypothetical protein
MKLGNKLKSVTVVNADEFILLLEFETGQSCKVSLNEYFNLPKGLARDIVVGSTFNKCFITPYGTLSWPNGIEFCPDLLMQKASEQSGKAA